MKEGFKGMHVKDILNLIIHSSNVLTYESLFSTIYIYIYIK